MDATSDGRLLILGSWTRPGLYAFDAATGASLGTVPLRFRLDGIPRPGDGVHSPLAGLAPEMATSPMK